eukprot:TRINITY_DN31125_c0_g1_i3.p1 TRINITY_DN31125_c0_g1~~TRINITY_DN31125_c0_g1_i3.p1  ORF type:complete len:370 (+),score=135.60 TRINITY_DN31125_c0_g1_i3:44-1111(+)
MSLYVEALVIYPVKSCEGITCQELEIGKQGFQYDRKWLVVDEEGKFVTRRSVSAMCNVLTDLVYDDMGGPATLRLSSKTGRQQPIDIKEMTAAHTPAANRKHVTVWRYTGDAWDCGDDAAAWVTSALSTGKKYRLVQFAANGQRKVNKKHVTSGNFPEPQGDYETAFADGYPYLVLSAKSIDDIDARAKARGGSAYAPSLHKLDWQRFRPNIIIGGAQEANEEDKWYELKVGDATFYCVTACERCVMTTLNTESLKFDSIATPSNPMPLFKQFREFGRGPLFGMNCVSPSYGGVVRVGDPIDVVELKTSDHIALDRTGVDPRGAPSAFPTGACLAASLAVGVSAAVAAWLKLRKN